jgi:hypothetical protein
MNDDRRSVLQMLADGKINADEPSACSGPWSATTRRRAPSARATGGSNPPKFLRVSVDTDEPGDDGGPTKVKIRVPMALLRAGVRLTSLIPPAARDQVNAELAKNGVPSTSAS